MLAGWKADGWPGPLTPENERVLEWAYAAASLGVEAADRSLPFEVIAGDEAGLVARKSWALGFVNHRGLEEARKRLEEKSKEKAKEPDAR